MAETTIRVKGLKTLIQKAKETHTRNVTFTITRGKLTASLFGWDNRGKPVITTIVIEKEKINGKE